MTAAEHQKEAETLVREYDYQLKGYGISHSHAPSTHLLTKAQVHATLAVAASLQEMKAK